LPLTTQDAIDVILLHSASSFEVLQHDEIPRQILFSYLHTKRVSVLKSDKFNMINKILQLWNRLHHNELTSVPVPEQETVMVCHPTEPKPHTEVCEFDELVRQFTQWFYSTLNQHDAYHLGTQLGVEHFWHDSAMQLVVYNEMDFYKADAVCKVANIVQLLGTVKTLYNIHFNPNLLPEGVKVKTQDQGLFTVVATGTSHIGDPDVI
jgi:hypothetical protein